MSKKISSAKNGPGVTLDRVHHNACRWPLGDPKLPDFHFCGEDVDGNRPYCLHHAKIAYLPPRSPNQQMRNGDSGNVTFPSSFNSPNHLTTKPHSDLRRAS